MSGTRQALTTKSGRPAAFGQKVRDRIDTTVILRTLGNHVTGKEEMSATQIQAARILLDRTVPVLRAVEVRTNQQVRDVREITTSELFDVIEGKAKRITDGD